MSSSSDADWTFARQTGGLLAQLSFGVRAFLLDMYWGAPLKEVVHTDFLSTTDEQSSLSKIPESRRKAVERLVAMAGNPDPRDRRVYLCHLYCELGATPAKSAFGKIHDWLRVNPNEVIILVLEDHVPAEAAVDVLEASGLADRAYIWSRGSSAPTLRQMIESKKNVLILAENDGDSVKPWYHDAYDRLLQDTPYKFGSVEELAEPSACSLGRGQRSAPLLLINHWLDTGGFAPKNLADEANSFDVLLDRTETCRDRLGQIPTIVAVDFYTEGRLRQVINRLNGVDVPDPVVATATGLPS
jgi:hypothetical protein